MMFKTHLAATVLFIFLFLPRVENRIIFVLIMLSASAFPDLDTPFSKYGKNKSLRILQFFVKHRTFFHSLTFAFLISLLFSLIFPKLAFAFFLGYSIHVLLDSFTVEGVMPFWPSRERIKWKIKTGGVLEKVLFKVLVGLIFLIALFWLVRFF